MKCPKCGSDNTAVKDSRQKGGKTWRRRNCLACGHLFSTYEIYLTEYEKQTKLETMLRDLIKAGVEND